MATDTSVKVRLTQQELSLLCNLIMIDTDGKPRMYALGDANIILPLYSNLQSLVHEEPTIMTKDTSEEFVVTNTPGTEPLTVTPVVPKKN